MKNIYIILVTILLPITAGAQTIEIGPKAGYAFSTTTFEEADKETNYVPGFLVGVGAVIGKKIKFQPEILFIQKGYKVDSKSNNDSWEYINNYIQIPLILNYGVIIENFRVLANFGPYISYWLSGKYETYVDGVALHKPYKFDSDLSDGQKDFRWDYGFSGGAGIGIRIFGGWLFLEGRYDYGFSDIRTIKNPTLEYNSIRNRTISGNLSYFYAL